MAEPVTEGQLVEDMARAIIINRGVSPDQAGDSMWTAFKQDARAILPFIKAAEARALERAAKVAEEFDTFDRDIALSARGAVVAIGIVDAIRQLGAGEGGSVTASGDAGTDLEQTA